VKNTSILEQLNARTTALTARELSRLLKVSEKTLYREVQSGRVPCVRIGSCIRFRRERIIDWLQAQDTGRA